MIEPDRLLEQYQAYLDDNGGILVDSIPKLLELMNSVNGKLVPKCISLCIISSSIPDTQYKLCKAGAWDILLKWLQEALKEDNFSFLIELLNLYLKLPVRLEQLTQNVCPKLINSLTKRSVKSIAAEIVKKWKAVISTDSRRVVDHTELKRKKSETDVKSEPVAPDSLKDEKKRRRTVKVPPMTMRTAGVEEATDIQPKSRSEVLSKRNKMETESKPQELPIESFHQKITVTPTEPRKVNVNRFSVEEIRRKELSMERQLFKRSADDFTISTEKWHSPLPLERVFLVEPGCKSEERQTQTERERYVLQAIYFTRESIPPTPEEPDVEVVEHTTPVDIPLEDLTLLEPVVEGAQFAPEKLLVVQDTMGNAQLWDVLEENYPDIKLQELSAERIRDLLEPLRDQLVARGIFQIPTADVYAAPNTHPSPPLRPPMRFSCPPAVPPNYHGPPPAPPPPPPTLVPVSHPDFRSSHPTSRPGPPMHNGYRGNSMPPAGHGPPHFLPQGPPPPFARGPGPMRGPPPPPPSQGPPPGHRPAPYIRGTGRGRGTQPCKFFQLGHCRNGPACTFLHSNR
ncbi:unnamed protein product [Echinostoma caproni]|uniref:Serine/threonine-protein phosphatase 1 regulatory subunit 10 n=1 Tax=Echinostoma caproni TaxID=27848 RepID=A0A183A571_9TREM|nr:unnamed protein product [Echinostoma caproni]